MFVTVVVWHTDSALVSVDIVALRQAWLVMGWVTVHSAYGYAILLFSHLPRII